MRVGPMADNEGSNYRLAVRLDVEEAGSLGRAEPLMAIARVEGGSDLGDIQRNHARGVRSVHQCVDTSKREFTHDLCQRKNQARLAGDVIQKNKPRLRRDRLQVCLSNL